MHLTASDILSWSVGFGVGEEGVSPHTLSVGSIMAWDPNFNQKSNKQQHNGYPAHPGYEVHPSKSDTKKSVTGIYHQQLHASLQAFQARRWRPLSPGTTQQVTITRCRPISGRPASAGQALTQRPPNELLDKDMAGISRFRSSTSTIDSYPRRPDTPRVMPGNFDTLSPRILSHLVTDPRPLTPNSLYGDIIELKRNRRSKKSKLKRNELSEEAIFNDTSSVFSGDSDDGDDVDYLESSSGSDSDDSAIPEPEIGLESTLDHRRKVHNLNLRPEQLDHIHVPDNKRDMRRFNFDAEKTEIPVYGFECPIPNPLNKINFRLHARENTNWRFAQASVKAGPEDPEIGVLLDRLVVLEKRQIDTEEWEEKRLKNIRKRSSNRAGGSATTRQKDKRCCSSCLQPCCVGDCPNKKLGHILCCETCHQPFCIGSCVETRYEQRMRQPPETITSLPLRIPLPKHCRTCQKKHNAKYINANQVVLGRPKSAFSTYSRGKKSTKPKDLRPKSAMSVERTIAAKIEQLGIDSIQPSPPSSAKPSSRPSSRNRLMPGKTYFSNLSHSLTDLTSKRKRIKSAGTRRPRSTKGRKYDDKDV